MSTDARSRLAFIEIAGSPYEAGVCLGRHGAEIVNGYLVKTHAWASVMALRDDPRVAKAKALVEQRFPRYWLELAGLAKGLGLSFDDVFAWNCRGDLWAMAPDGCTTVQFPGPAPVLGHNEDGDPRLREHCALAAIRSDGGKAFTAFVYPGSLPGHTFAATESGIVQTVNNIRSRQTGGGVPRMVLTRAVLDCSGIDEAAGMIGGSDRAGAFHLTLAQAGDPRLVSVEFTHTSCSTVTVERPQCHANHLIHTATASEQQIVTASSRARQERGNEIIANLGPHDRDPQPLLRDRAHPLLPIHREQPDDPDNENTLATAVFEIGADRVVWRVYDGISETPRFAMYGGLIPFAEGRPIPHGLKQVS
jgi:hypothetical protein